MPRIPNHTEGTGLLVFFVHYRKTRRHDPVLAFGRGIAKALQCFANNMSLNDPEVYYKSIEDVVGSPDEARVVDMLVLFKTMDVVDSCILQADPTTPAIKLGQA